VTLGANGSVALALSTTVDNGSALRYAIDGNFTPFIEALPINASAKATILSDLAGLEGSVLTASLFGNRDGSVESYEVNQFETLIQDESQFLPAGTLTASGGVYLHLDGHAATSATLGSVVFTNATGVDVSTAPIGVTTNLDYTFAAGSGSHTVSFGTNLTSGNVNLGLLVGAVGVTLSTPAGTSITSTSGFGSVSVANDPLGWGASSLSGSYTPGTSSSVSATYGPAFPAGDVIVVGVPIAAAAALVGFLLWRRRRRRRAAPPV